MRSRRGFQIGDERLFVSTPAIRSPLPRLRPEPFVRTTFISVITVAPSQPQVSPQLVNPPGGSRESIRQGRGEDDYGEKTAEAHFDPP